MTAVEDKSMQKLAGFEPTPKSRRTQLAVKRGMLNTIFHNREDRNMSTGSRPVARSKVKAKRSKNTSPAQTIWSGKNNKRDQGLLGSEIWLENNQFFKCKKLRNIENKKIWYISSNILKEIKKLSNRQRGKALSMDVSAHAIGKIQANSRPRKTQNLVWKSTCKNEKFQVQKNGLHQYY